MKYYNKSNNIIVIIVAIFLLLTSYLIYHFYFKDFGEYNKQEEKESIYIDVKDEKILNDILTTIKDNNLIDIAKLEKDYESINALDNTNKLNLIYKVFNNKSEFTIDEINSYLNNSFLGTIYYDNMDIYCDNNIIYKFEDNKYIYNEENNCNNKIDYTYKVISLKKKSNTYVITLTYLWSNLEDYYYTYKDLLNNNYSIKKEEDYLENNYNNIRNYVHEYTYIFEKKYDKYLLSGFKYK